MASDVMMIRRSMEILALPLEKTSRLHFKCLSVSKEYIVFGTNAGSIYIFDRRSLELLKFLGNKVTSLCQVLFAPDEKGLAVADVNGVVTCYEVDTENCLLKPIRDLFDHRGGKITALCWDESSARLFLGDSRGKVTSNIVFPFKLSAGKFLSKSTTETILKEERPIVQLDFFEERLLVSTYTRTLLCLTNRSQFLQVGSKPRDPIKECGTFVEVIQSLCSKPDGLFGSCFLRLDNGNTVIYSARPGSRLWEVDVTGQVIATHQFKRALAKSALSIVGLSKGLAPTVGTWTQPHSVNFPKLIPLKDRYLVTWSQYGIYIIDPTYGKVVDWYDQVKDIKDIICDRDSIYVLHSSGRVTELIFAGLKECLSELNHLELWADFAKVSVQNQSPILNDPEHYIALDFQDICTKLSEDATVDKGMLVDLKLLADGLEEKHNAVRAAVMERMNHLPDVSGTPTDSGVEDNDDVRSVGNASEASSSRRSLSRLAEIDVDSMVQKAKSALVNRIVNSGFIQKALKDALDAEGKRLGVQVGDQVNDISNLTSLTMPEVIVQPAFSDVASTPESLTSEISNKFSRRRRRKKPKTVDFGHGQDSESKHPLTRRSVSLSFLDAVSEQDDTKKIRSSPPSPSLHQATSSRHRRTGSGHYHGGSSLDAARIKPSSGLETGSGRSSPRSPYNSGSLKGGHILFQPNMDSLNLISELVDVTASSRNKLRDTRFLFSPTAVHSILQDWIEKFDDVVEKYIHSCISSSSLSKDYPTLPETNKEAFKMHIREDFFKRLGVTFSEISNLALLCFESGVFPASCKTLTILEDKLIDRSLTMEDCRCIVTRMSEIFALNVHNKSRQGKAESVVDSERTSFVNQATTSNDSNKFSDKLDQEENTVEKTLSCNHSNSADISSSQPSVERTKDCAQTDLDSNLEHVGEPGLAATLSPRQERQNYLCLSGNTNECDDCKADCYYACFVFRFFPLLDVSRIRRILCWSGHCRWRTWLAYFIRNEESADSETLVQAIRREDWGKVSRILLELSSPELLMAVSEELFDANMEIVKNCFQSGLLQPWEAHFLSLLVLDGYAYDRDVLTFLNKQSSEHAYQDKQILPPLLKYMLEIAHIKSLTTCECGKPKPGGHKVQIRNGDTLANLISAVRVKYKSNVPLLKRLGAICSQEGYWKGSLYFFASAGQTSDAFDLCRQLGDSSLLDELINEGSLTLDSQAWSDLISTSLSSVPNACAADLPTGVDSHLCSALDSQFVSSWTTEKLLWCMLRWIGANDSLEVLHHLPEPRSKIVHSFYFACLQMTLLEQFKRKAVDRVREIVCTDARTKGQSYMAARLESAKIKELRDAISSSDGDVTEQSNFVLSSSNGGSNQGQWGIGVVLFGSICDVCTLPLTTQAGFSSAGIIIFKCGHCFHRKCVPEERCVTCFLSDLKTIEPKKANDKGTK